MYNPPETWEPAALADTLQTKIWFAQDVLSRNDAAIQFSEAKSGFLFALMGLLLNGVIGSSERFVSGLNSTDLALKSLTILLAIAYVGGVLLSVYAAFMIILPRLKSSREESVVFFGDVARHELRPFVAKYNKLTKKDYVQHLIRQIHATSLIANTKFQYVRRMSIGVMLQIIAWLLFMLVQLGQGIG
jgi:hypothetical protein